MKPINFLIDIHISGVILALVEATDRNKIRNPKPSSSNLVIVISQFLVIVIAQLIAHRDQHQSQEVVIFKRGLATALALMVIA
jgi:hypothetical protein